MGPRTGSTFAGNPVRHRHACCRTQARRFLPLDHQSQQLTARSRPAGTATGGKAKCCCCARPGAPRGQAAAPANSDETKGVIRGLGFDPGSPFIPVSTWETQPGLVNWLCVPTAHGNAFAGAGEGGAEQQPRPRSRPAGGKEGGCGGGGPGLNNLSLHRSLTLTHTAWSV